MAEFDFVIPFRARSTTRNWPQVCTLLEQTIASVLNSSDPRCRMVIVGHEKPDFSLPADRCLFLEAEFSPPDAASNELPGPERIFVWHTDKGRKLLMGIDRARQDGAKYFMPLDADDLISSELVGHCLRHDHPHGYYVERGYRMDADSPGWLFSRKQFFHECGSSCILRTEVAPLPEKIDLSKDFDDYYIRRYVVHAYVPECLQKQGTPLQELSFPAAVYRFHDQNIFANSMRRPDSWLRLRARRLFRGKRITEALRREFCIPASDV